MFSGLLVCADCGHNLNYHFNQGNHDIKYFNCSNYKGNRGTCTSTHYIRVDFLEQVVLGEIKRLTKYAVHYEDEFQQAMVNELIDHIEVYQAEKIDGEWVQKLTIHYNCIGALFIPDTDTLPVPDVTVNTRRGVFVTYEPAQNEQ